MNPMSLLTLTPAMLREASDRERTASPSGERGERWLAAVALVAAVSTVVAACLLH